MKIGDREQIQQQFNFPAKSKIAFQDICRLPDGKQVLDIFKDIMVFDFISKNRFEHVMNNADFVVRQMLDPSKMNIDRNGSIMDQTDL